MRLAMRLAAGGVAFVGTVIWLFGGPNWGRTRYAIDHATIDAATGLPQVSSTATFLPGLDFLALVWGASATLFLVAFLFRVPLKPAPSAVKARVSGVKV